MRPLLRIPASHSDYAVSVQARMTGESNSENLTQSQSDSAVLKEIWQRGIGGTFWEVGPAWLDQSNEPLLLVSLGKNLQEARMLWDYVQHQIAQHKAALSAHHIVMVLPPVAERGHSHAKMWCRLEQAMRQAGVCCLSEPFDPNALVKRAKAVLTVEIDSLALLGMGAEIPVWILRDEGFEALSAEVAECQLMRFQYVDPFREKEFSLTEMMNFLSTYRTIMLENRRIAACAGMAWWKRARMREFLFHAPGKSPRFYRSQKAALREARKQNGALAVWAAKITPHLEEQAKSQGVELIRVEDGFIRSLGLGSGFLPPSSIVCDKRGNYFDPSRASTLEHLLATADFTPELRSRAERLVERLKREKISKYGAGSSEENRVSFPRDKTLILVPGQVADDLSVRLGGGEVKSNLALLEAVRRARPDAWIIYRPHPDVEAGHRRGSLPDDVVLRHANQIARGGSMMALLEQVDEVHTLTSLAGFEALLRGLRVTTWGTPFYAGWGLTEDKAPVPSRRGRRLEVLDLAAATLILYPRYLDPKTSLPCAPEVLLNRLAEPELWRAGPAMRLRKLQGRFSAWARSLMIRCMPHQQA